MKRIEVKLSLPVVAPLLDVIRDMADGLNKRLASSQSIPDPDQDFREAWLDELLQGQNKDLRALLALFDGDFFSEGVVAFDEENAEPIIRACAALRLRLRERNLDFLGDETLESGEVNLEQLDDPIRKAFMSYLFLATVQELIIQHLEPDILSS